MLGTVLFLVSGLERASGITVFLGLFLSPLLFLLFGDCEEAALRPQHRVLVQGLHQEEVSDFVLKSSKKKIDTKVNIGGEQSEGIIKKASSILGKIFFV